MTIRDYRLMVALRWGDLESLRVKDTPLKIHLQQLRKRDKWPTCCVYDESAENGPERYRRFQERKGNLSFCADDNVEIIVRRKASSWKAKPGDWIESPDDVVECNSEGEEIRDGFVLHDVQEESEVDELVDLGPNLRSYAGHGSKGRSRDRAERNNVHISSELIKSREILAKVKGTLRFERDPDSVRNLSISIFNLEKKIARLRRQVSDLPDLPRGFGTEVPPPPGFYSHTHWQCVDCNMCPYCNAYAKVFPECESCKTFVLLHFPGSRRSGIGVTKTNGSKGYLREPQWLLPFTGEETASREKNGCMMLIQTEIGPLSVYTCTYCGRLMPKDACRNSVCVSLLDTKRRPRNLHDG